MGKPKSDKHQAAVDALDRMETELRLLRGTVAILRALSETGDAVEPIALEAVAHQAEEVIDCLTLCWREATIAVRRG